MHDKNDLEYAKHKAEKQAKRELAAQEHDKTVFGLTFQGFPKIARLNREITITEKIDGTNAAIGIGPVAGKMNVVETALGGYYHADQTAGRVWAQSRTRLLSVHDDNMGFAAWVEEHKDILIMTLGPGLHFGEWWGPGIQRGYGLTEKRFSLFNTEQWGDGNFDGDMALANARLDGCPIYCVPLLYRGPWLDLHQSDSFVPDLVLDRLERDGSLAAPGFMKPEGVVIYHKASGTLLKATIEGDEKPKGSVEVS